MDGKLTPWFRACMHVSSPTLPSRPCASAPLSLPAVFSCCAQLVLPTPPRWLWAAEHLAAAVARGAILCAGGANEGRVRKCNGCCQQMSPPLIQPWDLSKPLSHCVLFPVLLLPPTGSSGRDGGTVPSHGDSARVPAGRQQRPRQGEGRWGRTPTYHACARAALLRQQLYTKTFNPRLLSASPCSTPARRGKDGRAAQGNAVTRERVRWTRNKRHNCIRADARLVRQRQLRPRRDDEVSRKLTARRHGL